MIGHQREVLASLGIDVWIPRSLSSQQSAMPSIWRDQSSPEIVSEIVLSQVVHEAKSSVERPIIQNKISQKTPPSEIKQQAVEQNTAVELSEVLVRKAIHVEPFQLQAITLAHCALVIDATQLSGEQQKLWQNIVQALPVQKYALQWPFPLLNLQDGRGVLSYIQGFLDGLSGDKTIITLGAIPNANDLKITQAASLQEMLDQPLLKRTLWQMMQSKQKQ